MTFSEQRILAALTAMISDSRSDLNQEQITAQNTGGMVEQEFCLSALRRHHLKQSQSKLSQKYKAQTVTPILVVRILFQVQFSWKYRNFPCFHEGNVAVKLQSLWSSPTSRKDTPMLSKFKLSKFQSNTKSKLLYILISSVNTY